MPSESASFARALEVLRETFGHAAFRPPQDEVVRALLSGRDAFALMPTGGGKSMCFQVPALVLPGACIVVSPLVALMDDQVAALRQAGVRAAALHSARPDAERAADEGRLARGELDLVYVAPERALGAWFRRVLSGLRVCLFAIDEAHCTSQWGHDFRPEYLRLHELMDALPAVPRLALTATADPPTRREILDKLGLRDPHVAVRSMDRPNFHYEIVPKSDAFAQLVAFLRERHARDAGIVYVRSRRGVEEAARRLREAGFDAHGYHAGMEPEERARVLARFLRDQPTVVCATIAFGMGIDKPDVRFVAHIDLPKSLEGYVQETGRAGRDGMPADAWMCWGMEDVATLRAWIAESEATDDRKRVEQGKLDQLVAFCQTPGCRRQALRPFFGEPAGEPCGRCDRCLDPPAVIDATVPAQKILSAMRRTGERFGAEHVVDILAGESRESVARHGHDRIPTFGAGKGTSREQWRHWILQLVALGHIHIDIERFRALRITPSGEDVLFARARASLQRLPGIRRPGLRLPAGADDVARSARLSSPLAAALRAERARQAEREGVPPWILFPDSSIDEIVRRRPRSRRELLAIDGLGRRRVETMADWILPLVEAEAG